MTGPGATVGEKIAELIAVGVPEEIREFVDWVWFEDEESLTGMAPRDSARGLVKASWTRMGDALLMKVWERKERSGKRGG